MPETEKPIDQVLRQVNHDLRTPLSTIAMGIEAIRMLKNDPAQLDAVCDMMANQGVAAIKKILDDMLAD